MRPSGRELGELRPVEIELNVNRYAEGSCLIKMGNTHVICTASADETVPPFLRKSGKGWVTGEYNMLPRSTHSRMRREGWSGKIGGRTQEISRLLGRSLRACVDRNLMGERQILIDCDVIQADGGTRCAAITGSWVALRIAMNKWLEAGVLKEDPIIRQIAAISVGKYAGQTVLDLDYDEDSNAEADGNYVMTATGDIVEVQSSAEGGIITPDDFTAMLEQAQMGVQKLTEIQSALFK